MSSQRFPASLELLIETTRLHFLGSHRNQDIYRRPSLRKTCDSLVCVPIVRTESLKHPSSLVAKQNHVNRTAANDRVHQRPVGWARRDTFHWCGTDAREPCLLHQQERLSTPRRAELSASFQDHECSDLQTRTTNELMELYVYRSRCPGRSYAGTHRQTIKL